MNSLKNIEYILFVLRYVKLTVCLTCSLLVICVFGMFDVYYVAVFICLSLIEIIVTQSFVLLCANIYLMLSCSPMLLRRTLTSSTQKRVLWPFPRERPCVRYYGMLLGEIGSRLCSYVATTMRFYLMMIHSVTAHTRLFPKLSYHLCSISFAQIKMSMVFESRVKDKSII